MIFKTKFGIGEVVIRETHKNGEMVQERMMEVVAIYICKSDADDRIVDLAYICEDVQNGHRQHYSESMLVGDPDFDQAAGEYPKDSEQTNR